jgi:hypothetical protein
LAGGKHVQFLLENKLLTLTPSPIVDVVYAKQKHPLTSTPQPTTSPDAHKVSMPDAAEVKEPPHPDGETMLLTQPNARELMQALDIPALEVELERAIWQVETAIEKQNAELEKEGSGVTKKPGGGEKEKSQ